MSECIAVSLIFVQKCVKVLFPEEINTQNFLTILIYNSTNMCTDAQIHRCTDAPDQPTINYMQSKISCVAAGRVNYSPDCSSYVLYCCLLIFSGLVSMR